MNRINFKFNYILIVLFIIIFFIGCADIRPDLYEFDHNPKIITKIDKKIVKNYILNRIQQAYVGDVVIEKGEWNITHKHTEHVKEIEYMYAQPIMNIDLGSFYPILKTNTKRMAKYDNKNHTYRVPYVNLDGDIVGWLIVSKDGVIKGVDGPGTFVWQKMKIPKKYQNKKVFNIVDKSRKIVKKDNSTEVVKGFSFQLIYTGLDNGNKNIKITYKEYINDMIRPAYTEHLTYAKSNKFIRFKKIKIEILGATNEYLKYKVVED